MAVLAGCTSVLPGALPDHRRPDVLRFDVSRRVVFVGEAKDTESATDTATVARLAAYMDWALVAARRGTARVAVCHPAGAGTDWLVTLRSLSGLALGGATIAIDDNAVVTWVDLARLAPVTALRHRAEPGHSPHRGAFAWHTWRPSWTRFTWRE